ncbi:MAG: hypothetical protein ACLRMJ_10655 [Alistipes finegoldii]
MGAVTALLVGCKWPDQALLASADETVSTAEQVLVGHFNAVSYFVAMTLTLVGFLFTAAGAGVRKSSRISPPAD